jgi:catabolite regulation protein CreA
MKQLDYNLKTDKERRLLVEELLKENDNPPAKILELYANYILYGKDEITEKSVVDDKKVQISTKYSSYASKTKVTSLEKLMEDVNNSERFLCKQKYSKPKIGIDREKDANIPNMTELWKTIDGLEETLNNNENLTDEIGRAHV